MSNLLDSRKHHQCVHVLSQKLFESNTHDEEPPKRRVPANPSDSSAMSNNEFGLTRRQRSQQECWQKERTQKSTHPPAMNDNDNHSAMQKRGQRLRRQRERDMRAVSLFFIACLYVY
jgi:hypothetical protein